MIPKHIEDIIKQDAEASATISLSNVKYDVANMSTSDIAIKEHELGYIAGAIAVSEKAQVLVDALTELVELKRMKDEGVNLKDYLERKPLAWEAAINALNQWNKGKEVENG